MFPKLKKLYQLDKKCICPDCFVSIIIVMQLIE